MAEPGKVYDEDNEKPVTRPDLKKLEEGQSQAQGHKPNLVNKKENASGVGLKNAEQAVGAQSDKPISDKVGRGFNPVDKPSRVKRLATLLFYGKRKYAVGGGGIAGILIFFILSSIIPLELVHIEKTLLGYEARIEERLEKEVAKKLMQKMICWQVKGGCKDDPEDNDDKPSADDEAAAEANGEELTQETDGDFEMTNPKVEADLAKTGITVETDSAGDFTGLEDSQGNQITDEVGSDSAVGDRIFNDIESVVPEYEDGQEISFRPVMTSEADSSFDILPDTDTDNAQKTIQDEVTNGADGNDISTALADEDDQEPPSDSTPAETDAFNNAQAESTDLANAENKVESDIQAGDSEPEAIADGVGEFNLGSGLLASSAVSDVCTLEKVASEASNGRVHKIMSLLIRHATTLISLADQTKSGDVKSSEVNSTMGLLNGDPSAPPNANGTKAEASLPFTSSAAWQRATGGQVDSDPTSPGYTPDISSTALPTADSGTKVVSDINSDVSKYVPGHNVACDIENSAFGGIANILGGVVQFFADDATIGAAQLAITGGLVALQQTLRDYIIPEILEYFTPVGIDGHEDSVQWLNNSDAGMNLAENNYSRRVGGESLNATQSNTLSTEANSDAIATASQLPLADRIFSLSDPYSLISHFADDLPLGFDQTMASLTGYFTNMPSIILHNVATIFGHTTWAAPSNVNPGASYGITQYSFTDSETEKYDPIQNEQYLFSTVSYGGNTMRRIDMLGNPNTYVDTPAGDRNNNDLLHCFVDPYTLLADTDDGSNNAAKQYCGALPDPNPLGANLIGGLGTFDCADQGVSTGTASDPGCNDSPNEVPGDLQVVQIYCQALIGNANDPLCDAAVYPQVNDDVGHFRQYLLDTHVMADYVNLLSSS